MNNKNIKLYRKRLIPNELILLEDDKILHQDSETIVTRWDSLKPRNDIASGISLYLLNEGFKISKIFDKDQQLVYWYCDIIEHDYNPNENTYIFTDLLADVIVCPDNFVKVLDLEEIGEALEKAIITKEKAAKALSLCNKLLEIIYQGNFSKYQKIVDAYE